jgi:hypothetical protein
MSVVHISKGARTTWIQTRFRLGPGDSPEVSELEDDMSDDGRFLAIPAERIARFSPNTRSILEIRTSRDLGVLDKLFANGVLLGDQSPNGWAVDYAREFDMTTDSRLFPPLPEWEDRGYKADEYGHWLKGSWRESAVTRQRGARDWNLVHSADNTNVIPIDRIEDVALPVYEGRMIDQYDFSNKGWVSGKGRKAVWRELRWEKKRLEPQFLMARSNAGSLAGIKLGFMDVAASINERTLYAAPIPRRMPAGNKVPVLSLRAPTPSRVAGLACTLNSVAYDFVLRSKFGGNSLNYFIIAETPILRDVPSGIAELAFRLSCSDVVFADAWVPIKVHSWRRLWAITQHERIRIRAILDAAVAELYGLDEEDVRWILRGCDHPVENVCNKPFARSLDPKGFWRADKGRVPELRHPVLSLVAFNELKKVGLENFLALNNGDG